jgi:predicted small secreted protein
MNITSTLYIFVAAASLAMAACQPAEGPAERAGKSLDEAAQKVSNQAEKAGDKLKEKIDEAKK